QLAHAVSLMDKLPAPHYQRANRRTQPLGETEHHRVYRACYGTYRHTQRGRGIKYTCAIHMHLHIMCMSQARQRLDLLDAQNRSTAAVMRVLDAEQGRGSR